MTPIQPTAESRRGLAPRAPARRLGAGRAALLISLLCAAAAACDSPTTPKAQLDLVTRSEPLRGAYGLPAPVTMPDGRRLYWAQLSFWGKHDPSEGQDTWTGTYSVKDGGDCATGLTWGVFTLASARVMLDAPQFTDVVLSADRHSLDVTIQADGTAVRTTLLLDAKSPL